MHPTALPTILYHYEDTLAEEAESSAKGRHAPTRQAGLSELLCVVGRLLLRKVLTSYQTSLEEEQNQQLLVRLVLSHFQAQTLERQARQCADSLLEEVLEEDAGSGKASKRKLKKERQKKSRQGVSGGEGAEEQQVAWDEQQEGISGGEGAEEQQVAWDEQQEVVSGGEGAEEQQVAWDEQQELALLSQMGWHRNGEVAGRDGGVRGHSNHVELVDRCSNGEGRDVGLALALDALDTGMELTESEQQEFLELAQHKGQLMEERRRMREALKQRFEEFCERKAEPASG